MFYKPLLLPLMIQVLLTFVVWHRMYFDRISEMQQKRIDPQRINTRRNGRELLTDSATSADNFMNQFEMPVLFYLAIVLLASLMLSQVTPMLLAETTIEHLKSRTDLWKLQATDAVAKALFELFKCGPTNESHYLVVKLKRKDKPVKY